MSFFVNLLKATRPHTYPLSLVGVLVGNAIAWTQLRTQGQITDSKFWLILSLTLLTAVSLQILSNLANDYGDGKRGTDVHRTDRHFGDTLSPQMLMNAIIGFVGLICVSGLTLLVLSLGMGREFWGFLGLGACAIIAAITYTMGKNPYGYKAKGELAVFVFFGMVNVLGSSYLQSKQISGLAVLFAIIIGVLCTCVLTVNNLRDIDSDRQVAKTTLVTLLGKGKTITYYKQALIGAFVLLGLYAIFRQNYYFIALIVLSPLCCRHVTALHQYRANALTPQIFAKQLKSIVQITLMTGLISSISLILK